MADALTLSEARKLAKYYGKLCQRHHELVMSDKDKKRDWDCLSYCRNIILKKSRKKESQNIEQKNESLKTTYV